jgi:hypothetical protein
VFIDETPNCMVARNLYIPEIPTRWGECDSEKHIIFIREGVSGDDLKHFLLHEMCHIGEPSHGKRFLKRLQHLAEMGEMWAINEIESYKKAPNWNQSMANLRHTISDWSLELERSITFEDVLTPLAHELGVTPGELLKSAPWVKAAWENSRKEAMTYPEYMAQFQR